MTKWTGVNAAEFNEIGHVLVNNQEVPLLKAHVWIHRNRPATTERLPRPFRMNMPEGIAMYAKGMPAPRLPLLGLRGLVSSDLRLTLEGSSQEVSLRN